MREEPFIVPVEMDFSFKREYVHVTASGAEEAIAKALAQFVEKRQAAGVSFSAQERLWVDNVITLEQPGELKALGISGYYPVPGKRQQASVA